ncbi:DMT family transporter [Hydrogenispora ethanolica]|uniref:DMT family transporter n=1 Tax=Hydrogenispora ethanolica TaxID=1082276 RepID=UPI001404FBF7|nr:EamA family transporter [Hydrogenispora ethanolica]
MRKTGKPHDYLIHLELLWVVALWAGTFVATKMVLAQIPPAASALLRYVIAAAILVGFNLRNRERVAREDYPVFLGLGLTGVTLYYLLQHYGIGLTTASDAAVLISLSPVFIGIISWLWLGEKLKASGGTGLVLALAGAILVIGNGKALGSQPPARLWGNCLILLTAVSWAVYSVWGKRMLVKYQPLTLITATTIIGAVLLVPFALPELSSLRPAQWTWLTWLNLLYLGGAASVYGYLAWYRGLERLPAVTVGSYLYFRPLLTGWIAAVVLHERIGLSVVAGAVLIILGTYLTTK